MAASFSVQAAPDPDSVPWGIASSASAYRNHAEWFPKMSSAGVRWVRLFPEWRGIEPAQGTWNWDRTDALLQNAAKNQIHICAILMGSTPWTKDKAHAFPMNNLDEWSTYTSTVVGRYKNQVRFWEVWNEGNGGFNDGKHTTTDYANLAAVSYAAAKKVDPQAQVGLTVASFDAPYLNQAILAQAKAGKPNSFDFLCIHPYEIADGIGDPGGEIPYLWMSRLLRDMLKTSAPERANADIWITEISRRIENRNGKNVTEEDAAKTLVKLYVMALAQGIKHTLWFEAQDPQGEDQGFGLLKRDGTPRAAYRALQRLTAILGPTPKYEGWLTLRTGKAYAFVFSLAPSDGERAGVKGNKYVLIAWASSHESDAIALDSVVDVADLLGPHPTSLKIGQYLALNDRPVFVTGLPEDLVQQAQANAAKNFPWGGDYTSAKTVSLTLGTPDAAKGIWQTSPNSTPIIKFPDASTGVLVRGDQATSYHVHPSFASFQTHDYYVRVTVRRVAPGNVGMNLFYEAADSQGRTPYKNSGQWFSASPDNAWQTHTWHITDACFSKMWGYDISFRPEQSVPFVIGKIEVSTAPF